MTTQDQRDKMIASLSRIEQWQSDYEIIAIERYDRNEKDHEKVIKRLDIINGRVRENEKTVSNMRGYGAGLAFVLGLAIAITALFL